jgi:hypothetical protein
MEKVLEKKVVKKVKPKKVVKKFEVKQEEPKVVKPAKEDAIERLTLLNGTLVEKVQVLFSEINDLKNRIDQVASRLGL